MKIKKILIICITSILLLLTGCNKDESQITFIAPKGTPALSTLFMSAEEYKFDYVEGSDLLKSAFLTKSHEVIIAPSNLGSIMYNNNQNYRCLGVVVWGNYYLVTTGIENFSLASLEEKEIVVFGQNSTSMIILEYILDSYDYENEPSFTYVDSVSTAQGEFILDPTKIILTAEPSLSILMTKVEGISIIDLQAEYKKLSGSESYPQASVFVLASLSEKKVNKIKKDIQESISSLNSKPSDAAQKANQVLGLPVKPVEKAIPRCNIAFKSASTVKSDIITYFNLIKDTNPSLIGGDLPEDDFYY